jgi:hypothetical protein
MVEEVGQIMIMDGATCLGCSKENTFCLEIGLKNGLTLACHDCINGIFKRIESVKYGEGTSIHEADDEDNNNQVINIKIDTIDDSELENL